MIPILYDQTETAFASNGVCRLSDCVSCVVTEERNGIYECDFEYPVNGIYYDQIECGRVIGCTHDDSMDVQPFDIVSYSRPLNGIVRFHAVHISYRQTQMVCRGTNIQNLTAAFNMLKTATPSNPFSYDTDIPASTIKMAAADGVPRTVRNMLGGVEGSILDTYGGEFEWDKWKVHLWSNRGETKGFVIRYGVNLMDYKEDTDFSTAYSSVIPYWTKDDPEGRVTVVGNKVTCSDYPMYVERDICLPLDLTEKFQDQPTAAQLQTAALSYMQSNTVNLPKQNITVNFVRIQDSEEYSMFAEMLKCKLCDRIQVVFPRYNIQATFKIVKTTYDVLKGRYTEMELGSLPTTLTQALGIKKK